MESLESYHLWSRSLWNLEAKPFWARVWLGVIYVCGQLLQLLQAAAGGFEEVRVWWSIALIAVLILRFCDWPGLQSLQIFFQVGEISEVRDSDSKRNRYGGREFYHVVFLHVSFSGPRVARVFILKHIIFSIDAIICGCYKSKSSQSSPELREPKRYPFSLNINILNITEQNVARTYPCMGILLTKQAYKPDGILEAVLWILLIV